MNLELILALLLGILDVIQFVYNQNELSRIKAKLEVWNKDAQSIVNIAAKIQERIKKNEITNVKDLRGQIEDLGAFANGMHIGFKEE